MDWNWTLSNTNYRSALLLLVAGNALCVAMAQTGGASVVALTPPEMKWTKQGALAAPGLEQFNLVGDPTRPGPYTLRLKFPKGYRIAPHTHPDSREVTIISGVFATGYGETFDNAKLKILPAGSFITPESGRFVLMTPSSHLKLGSAPCSHRLAQNSVLAGRGGHVGSSTRLR